MAIIRLSQREAVMLVFADDPAIDPIKSDLASYLKDPAGRLDALVYCDGEYPTIFECCAIDAITFEEQVQTRAGDLSGKDENRLGRLIYRESFRAGVKALHEQGEEIARFKEGVPDDWMREVPWDVIRWVGEKIYLMSKAGRGVGSFALVIEKSLEYRAALQGLVDDIGDNSGRDVSDSALEEARRALGMPEDETLAVDPESEPGKS
jgi:hypothetical protein